LPNFFGKPLFLENIEVSKELLTFFCLDTKESKQRKSQGCIHFLTLFRDEKGGTNNDF